MSKLNNPFASLLSGLFGDLVKICVFMFFIILVLVGVMMHQGGCIRMFYENPMDRIIDALEGDMKMDNEEQTMLTILNYKRNGVAAEAEVHTLWHGAEHRVNELIKEWGDIDNWETTHNSGYIIAVNPNLGAEIILRLRELQINGHES